MTKAQREFDLIWQVRYLLLGKFAELFRLRDEALEISPMIDYSVIADKLNEYMKNRVQELKDIVKKHELMKYYDISPYVIPTFNYLNRKIERKEFNFINDPKIKGRLIHVGGSHACLYDEYYCKDCETFVVTRDDTDDCMILPVCPTCNNIQNYIWKTVRDDGTMAYIHYRNRTLKWYRMHKRDLKIQKFLGRFTPKKITERISYWGA